MKGKSFLFFFFLLWKATKGRKKRLTCKGNVVLSRDNRGFFRCTTFPKALWCYEKDWKKVENPIWIRCSFFKQPSSLLAVIEHHCVPSAIVCQAVNTPTLQWIKDAKCRTKKSSIGYRFFIKCITFPFTTCEEGAKLAFTQSWLLLSCHVSAAKLLSPSSQLTVATIKSMQTTFRKCLPRNKRT
jgi:hypothetical protein